VDLAIAANDAGDYFPLHGTCLGFEALLVYAAGTAGVLEPFKEDDAAATLDLAAPVSSSRLLSSLTPEVLAAVEELPLAFEAHMMGASPGAFAGEGAAHPALGRFYRLVTTSRNSAGQVYASSARRRRVQGARVQGA